MSNAEFVYFDSSGKEVGREPASEHPDPDVDYPQAEAFKAKHPEVELAQLTRADWVTQLVFDAQGRAENKAWRK